MTITKIAFERVYRAQNDAKVKERMLLILNVLYHGKVAAHVAREIHRSRGWACQWLKRHDKEAVDGLKDRPKGGRHPKISKKTECKIKTLLKESNHGWTTKQVDEMIIEESGVKYNHNYIYSILCRWGFRQKAPRKVHVNTTASAEEKRLLKKGQPDTCG